MKEGKKKKNEESRRWGKKRNRMKERKMKDRR